MSGESFGCLQGCGRPAIRRGLCFTCYMKSIQRIKDGQTTWAKLERRGKAAAKKPHFGNRKSKKPRK